MSEPETETTSDVTQPRKDDAAKTRAAEETMRTLARQEAEDAATRENLDRMYAAICGAGWTRDTFIELGAAVTDKKPSKQVHREVRLRLARMVLLYQPVAPQYPADSSDNGK